MARLCCLTQLGMLLMGVCKVIISPGGFYLERPVQQEVRWRRFHGRYVSQDTGSFDPIASG